jgi:hypothetical protein
MIMLPDEGMSIKIVTGLTEALFRYAPICRDGGIIEMEEQREKKSDSLRDSESFTHSGEKMRSPTTQTNVP